MNFPEIAESEVISASLMSEADMLEARLAVIRSPEIQNNLREVSVLRERLKALVAELAVLEKGKMIPADRERPSISSKLTSRETFPERKPRRARVTEKEERGKLLRIEATQPKIQDVQEQREIKQGSLDQESPTGIKSDDFLHAPVSAAQRALRQISNIDGRDFASCLQDRNLSPTSMR